MVHRVSTTLQAGDGTDLRSLQRSEVRGLGIRLIRDHRIGYASTSDFSTTAIADAVRSARDSAAVTGVDESQILPRPGPPVQSPDLVDVRWGDATLHDKSALVIEVARRVGSADPRIQAVDTCELYDEIAVTAIASTTGVRSVDRRAFVELWCDAVGEDETGRVADSGYVFARCLAEISPDVVVAETRLRTTRLLGKQVQPSNRLPLILDPAVVAELFEAVGRGVAGGAVSSGRSPFAGQIGAIVAAPNVGLVDSGVDARARAASRHDDEGVPRRVTTVICDGVFESPLYSTVTAAAAGGGATSTGNAHRRSYRSPPRAAASGLALGPTVAIGELPQRVPEAIYLQQLSGAGSGINAVTGRVDVGGTGWLWRDGEPAGRIVQFSFTTSLQRILAAVTDIADDVTAVAESCVLASTLVCGPDVVA